MKKLITPYCADFGRSNVVIKHFPDAESYVQIPKTETFKNEKITIYHRLYPEPDKRIFELLLVLSRVKKESKHIELFVPYLPYARQDRENKKGEAVSADVLCGILKSFGVKKLITYDCHFLPKPGNFERNGLQIENRSAGKQLFSYAKKYFDKEKFVVISPDEGSSYFIENAQGCECHSLTKVRHESKATGEKTGIHADIHKIEGEVDVENKNVCILDDIISTGGTIIRAIEHLKSRGAKKIIVGATHGVFAGEKIAEKILKASCEKIFVTNAIIQSENSDIEIIKLPKN
ncbi:MAG: ribose-phosphate diphosphokinase [Candidatus Nomurabacteria bacterium]|nr:ribose-phosphate diphosphokinase [Candidatus Nomurabacteria bacterium]